MKSFSFKKKDQETTEGQVESSSRMKSFSFKKKEEKKEPVVEQAPPPSTPPKKVKAEPTAAAADDVAKSSSGGSSKFGSFGFGKKTKDTTSSDEPAAAPTPSPKKSRQQKQQVEHNDHDEPKSSSSRRKSSCCSCKRLFVGGFCIILLTIVGIVTWRYGPWAKDSASVESFTASNTCDTCCNGLESNCDLAVNEVLFPMVQNAHSSYDNNFVGASNNKPFEEALVAGYRALSLSTCMCENFLSKVLLEQDVEFGLGNSNLGFCHTACGAGVRDPKDVLTNLKTFLETNQREVLIIELNMNEGSSADLRAALRYSGLLEYIYHPQDEYYIEKWPTLQQLIDNNTRLILFGSGDGMKSCPAKDCEDGILYVNDHMSQSNTDGSDLELCEPTITGDVYISYFKMNNFADSKLKMPSVSKARELNSYSKLEMRFLACQGRRAPNLLAVEFWDEGEVLDFVLNENKGKNREGGEYAKAEEDVPAQEDETKNDENQQNMQGMGFGRRHGLRG